MTRNVNTAPNEDYQRLLGLNAAGQLVAKVIDKSILEIEKQLIGDDAVLRLLTGASSRVELGLIGNDNLTIRVSPDGVAWLDALTIDKNTGEVFSPQNLLSPVPMVTAQNMGDLSVVYTTQVLSIRKFDGLAVFGLRLTFTPTFTTASGQLRITGFPFNFAGGAGSVIFGGAGAKPSYPVGATMLGVNCSAGNNFLILTASGDGFVSALNISNFVSGSQYILNASGVASI